MWPKDDDERQKALDAGHDLDRVLVTDELVQGEDVFFVATGITDGELLNGVRYRGSSVRTHSIVTRSRSGTIRIVESEHSLDKLRAYASVDFEHATLSAQAGADSPADASATCRSAGGRRRRAALAEADACASC